MTIAPATVRHTGSVINSGEPPAARRPRNASRTRQDILSAAGQRFARSGYSHVTMKEIADDVGVTPALVVRYFGSKLALFEEVARSQAPALEPLGEGELYPQLEQRARDIVSYFSDREVRAPGVALVRSLDVDDGTLFREELERRLFGPWAGDMGPDRRDPDGTLRAKLIGGLLMGVGLFTVGALVDPDRAPLDEREEAALVHYLTQMLALCVEPEHRPV